MPRWTEEVLYSSTPWVEKRLGRCYTGYHVKDETVKNCERLPKHVVLTITTYGRRYFSESYLWLPLTGPHRLKTVDALFNRRMSIQNVVWALTNFLLSVSYKRSCAFAPYDPPFTAAPFFPEFLHPKS